MERQGAVKQMPHLQDQVGDSTRQTPFTYASMRYELAVYNANDPNIAAVSQQITMSEHEGLLALTAFLRENSVPQEKYDSLAEHMGIILRSLNFIGQPEYSEATAGLASYWKGYLGANKRHQLCLPTPLSGIYPSYGHKSDMYVLDSIFSHFSDQDFDRLAPRILSSTDQITAKPKHTKIGLVDDLSVSGYQMQLQFLDVQAALGRGDQPEYSERVEAHLLAGSPQHIKDGISDAHDVAAGLITDAAEKGETSDIVPTIDALVDTSELVGLDRSEITQRLQSTAFAGKLTVRAYYAAHNAEPNVYNPDGRPIYSTLHSSTDFSFEEQINWRIRKADAAAANLMMPPLTNIVRTYRAAPLSNVERWQQARG
jgi:hypothetical protein